MTVVASKGRVVHFEARGLADIASNTRMTEDTVFELWSMTKPITAAAILTLAEEGRLRLDDPVGRFVPEYQQLSVTSPPGPVATAAAVPLSQTPADRPITIRDVLTHTAGLVSGSIAVPRPEIAADVPVAGRPRLPTDTIGDYVTRMAEVPLLFQPGTRYQYSGALGFDLLARVVEVVSGQTFDQFLREWLFRPLGMKDTAHNLTEPQRQRLATRYQRTPDGFQVPETPYTDIYFGGGWGLKGTAEDYLRFAQMLLNEGELDGKRVLSPRAVELMRSAHIDDTLPGRLAGEGYGLGVRVITDGAKRATWLSNGTYGWSGFAGTHFFVDPLQDIVGILMVHTRDAGLRADFETVVMQALVNE